MFSTASVTSDMQEAPSNYCYYIVRSLSGSCVSGPEQSISTQEFFILVLLFCVNLCISWLWCHLNMLLSQKHEKYKIVPVFKTGDISCLKICHPMSLLSNISKVFEYLTHNKITDYICQMIIMSPATSHVMLCTMLFVDQNKLHQPVLSCWWSQEVLRTAGA